MVKFKFRVFLRGVKVILKAIPLRGTGSETAPELITAGRSLTLELTEKLILKYLQQCEHDFGQLIESMLMVANDMLLIHRPVEYLVSDVHQRHGFFTY